MSPYYDLDKLRSVPGFEKAMIVDPYAGSVYFNRMKDLGLYTINRDDIERRVKDAGLVGVFDKRFL